MSRPTIIVDADTKELGTRFMGLPERWMDAKDKLWRCVNGHVCSSYISSDSLDRPRAGCRVCRTAVWLTFPEDVDDVAPAGNGEKP